MGNSESALGLILTGLLLFVFYLLLRKRSSHSPKNLHGRKPPELDKKIIGNVPALDVICVQGPQTGHRRYFQRPWMTIGRQPNNDFVLDGSLVSRHHAVLYSSQNGIVLLDLDSMNGTWVNGRRVVEASLSSRDSFQIGPDIFQFSSQGQPLKSPLPIVSIAEAQVQSHNVDIRSLSWRGYTYDRLIAKGGAANVFLFTEPSSGNNIAVKALLDSADPYFIMKFEEERKVGLQLKHPHIVRTIDTGDHRGEKYLVMEYLPGGNLRDRLKMGVMGLAEAVAITMQVSSALGYAHKHKIYHRDIKPENILFTQDYQAKLADFGIARLTGMRTKTQEGMLIGTPEYMSYEQARGINIDGRSDQYSMAIVLYEMLTGHRPFQGDPLSIVGQHLSIDPPNPRRYNPTIPLKVEQIIMKSLSKNKKERFRSMSSFAEALANAI